MFHQTARSYRVKVLNYSVYIYIHSDAHTVADVDYKWKGGKGVEIVSSQMAQFDLLRVVTENEASTNSKGRNKETVESVLLFYIFYRDDNFSLTTRLII